MLERHDICIFYNCFVFGGFLMGKLGQVLTLTCIYNTSVFINANHGYKVRVGNNF